MGRYERAIDKEEPKQELVQTFSFENEIPDMEERRKRFKRRSYDYFDPPYSSEPQRVGIVFEDEKKLFTGTYTHWCKIYFLCKSTNFNKERCCSYSKKALRIGCALIIYNLPTVAWDIYEIKPWSFGIRIYDKLKEMHTNFSVFNHDFYIKRTHNTLRTYEIMPAERSLWRSSTPHIQKGVIERARPIIDNMKDYLAADLTLSEIEELLNNKKAK